MNQEHALDPVIELRLAARHATIPLHALAAQLRLPVAELRGVCLALLLSPPAQAGVASPSPDLQDHGLEGGGRGREERTGRNEPTNPERLMGTKTTRSFVGTETNGSFVAREAGEVRSPQDLARWIAAQLHDEGGLRTYAKLCERYPPGLLQRALELTLRRPAAQIHRTRGAYFMGLVAILAKKAPTNPL